MMQYNNLLGDSVNTKNLNTKNLLIVVLGATLVCPGMKADSSVSKGVSFCGACLAAALAVWYTETTVRGVVAAIEDENRFQGEKEAREEDEKEVQRGGLTKKRHVVDGSGIDVTAYGPKDVIESQKKEYRIDGVKAKGTDNEETYIFREGKDSVGQQRWERIRVEHNGGVNVYSNKRWYSNVVSRVVVPAGLTAACLYGAMRAYLRFIGNNK